MRANNTQTTIMKILNRTIKNITIFLFFTIISASTIYIDPSKETFNEIKWKFSNIDRINFLFNFIDSEPKDDYLYYNELYMYQKITEPNTELKLTPNIYRQLCQLFNANPRTGLTKEDFNSSYYLHSNALGTDLDNDFSIVLDKYITYHIDTNQYKSNKYPPNSY